MNRIDSENISLREHGSDEDDLRNYHALFSNKEVMKYIIFPMHESISESKQKLLEQLSNNDEKLFTVMDKTDSRYIGLCGISIDAEDYTGEVGYMLFPEYWNRGIASEIVRLLMAYGLENLNLSKIKASCDVRNKASERVMLKCGMKKEVHLTNVRKIDGVISNELKYAIRRNRYCQGSHSKI